MQKLCIILGDHPIDYCGGLGIRFNKMIIEMEKHFEIKIFTKYNVAKVLKLSNTEVYGVFNSSILSYAKTLSYAGKNLHILCGLGICDKLIQISWKPDIVLCADHVNMLGGFYVSTIFKSKFIIEFDLALFSYEKIYNKEQLNGENKQHSNFINDIENMACNNADLVIMCSKFYEDVCPYKMNKVITVENGINLDEFYENIEFKFPNSKENDINLIYIGRFNSQKGIELMLNLNLPKNVHLYFIGSDRGGNLYSVVRHYCEIKKNFHFLGEKKGKEKIGILKNADAVLFPSRHEPFGIVGLECMASKTLCITTRIDGIGTYMDKDMCIEIEDFNIEKAINEFINMNENEKQKRIDKAYERVKNYTWDKISKKMVDAIKLVYTD